MDKIIGIDVGTSNVKICLYNVDGIFLQESSFVTPIIKPQIDYVEMDLDELFKKIIENLYYFEAHLSDVISIGFSVTSPTVVFLDNDYCPILNGILYQDNRVSKLLEEFIKDPEKVEYFTNKTGNHLSSSTCSALLINWATNMNQASERKIHKVCYLNSFLAYRFGAKLAVDPTIASYSGLVDIRNPYLWDEDLLNFFNVNKGLLPEIVKPFERVNYINQDISRNLGMSQFVTIALGAADTAVSSYILNVNSPNECFESIGTSEVFTICLDEPNFSESFMNRSHIIPGLWLAHGAMSSSGAALSWIANDILKLRVKISELELLAINSPIGSNGVLFAPYLCGERSPYFDNNASGVYFGLSLHSTQYDIIRATFEGVAYGMYSIYEIATSLWDIKDGSVRCIGGGANSNLGLQIRADLFNTSFRKVKTVNPAAYGAAMLGAVAAGKYQLTNVPFLQEIENEQFPNSISRMKYLKNYFIYKQLYPLLNNLMKTHKQLEFN